MLARAIVSGEAETFVTGAAGFIGRRLSAALAGRGHAVRALVRAREDAALSALGARVVTGDLLDPGSYRAALSGVSVVVHLGGDARLGDGPHYEAINAGATRALLDAVKDVAPALRRFVFVSSLSAVERAPGDRCTRPLDHASEPHPSTDYGRSKLAAERAVAASGLPFTVVRPGLVAGAGMRAGSHVDRFVRMSLEGSPVAWLDFPGRMSIVHVADLVDALLLVAAAPEAEGRTFVAAGEAARLGDVFHWARPALPRLPVRWVSPLLTPLFARLPHRVKALVTDAMVGDDRALEALGWRREHSARATVEEVAATR